MADIPVLLCTAGALAGRTIRVPEGGLDIGRSEDNHVVVQDEGVSRFHARLLYDNGSLWLQDAGSRNGVFVNGVRITGHKALKVGDEITIALHQFTVHWANELETGETSAQPSPSSSNRDTEDSSVRRGSGDAASGSGDTTEDTPKRRWFWPFS